MMYLLTMGWFLAHTSLAMTPEHSATNGEYSSLRFRMGSHLLPIERGRHLRLPRHRRVCRLYHTGALGDERHMFLKCPALADLRDEYSPLVAECSGVTSG